MSGRDHSETCECDWEPVVVHGEAHVLTPVTYLAQLRADLARVTAERDAMAEVLHATRSSEDALLVDRAAWRDRAKLAESERDALRADLARVTAERDEAVRQAAALRDEADRVRHNTWVEGDMLCYHSEIPMLSLINERDALRALLPTEAEREALGWLRGSLRSHTDTFARTDPASTANIALAYLDRLLGGGR